MTNATIEIARVPSPIGTVGVASRNGALLAVHFENGAGIEADVQARSPGGEVVETPDPAGAVGALEAYFDGDLDALDRLRVDAEGTPFQRAVWRAIREVPRGATASYGDIARTIGSPRAVRAVGTATGANPVGLVVPCHRIVRGDGAIGNYGGGPDRKRWLLRHEGALTT